VGDVLPGLAAALPLADPDDGRIDALRRAPGGASRAAATELQTVFLTQLLRAMRKTVPEDDLLPRSPERSVYEDQFDRTVAESLAARDPLGLVAHLAEGPGFKNP
jgi:Rod binding domain-containing protein